MRVVPITEAAGVIRPSWLISLALVFLIFAMPHSAAAQSIVGTVKDNVGSVLPGS
jgi:hypothetical protein